MTIKSRVEKIESKTPKRKERGLDLSGLTDEELRTLEKVIIKKENGGEWDSEEEEAEIMAIMAKVPGWNNEP